MSMFTRKTESSNCWARTALSPSATTIATIAIIKGTSPATTAPKTRRRMMSAAKAELELAVLQVLLREEVEVVVERLRAGHRHDERAVIVDGLDLLDERLRLVVVEARSGRSSRGDPPRPDRRPRRRGTCSLVREP